MNKQKKKRKSVKKKRERKREIVHAKLNSFYLSQDIIDEILVRLPAKTLIRFKSVCVSWFSLISDPKFIKRHLVESSFSNSKLQRLLLCHRQHNYDNCDYTIKSCQLHFYKDDNDAYITDHPTTKLTRNLSILGSCNGLVCVGLSFSQAFLWNPSINQSKELPVVDDIYPRYDSYTYGFGYDQGIDDYKVVLICCKRVQVYSLKADSWKKISDFPYLEPNDMGIHVNGVLHWKVKATDSNSSMVIVSLDLGNETYAQVSQPCYGKGNVTSLSLGILEGCLSIFCKKTCFDIWVMKEYCVGGTWTKLYSIAFTTRVYGYHIPLCTSLTGEILFKNNGYLRLYKPGMVGQVRAIMIGKVPRLRYLNLQAITYVESLVSPFIDNESSRQDKSMERW